MKPIIYAVEDEFSIRELYSYALEGAGFISQCFVSGVELFKQLEKTLPDLIILDVMLDDIDGFEILQKLQQSNRYARIPVIMVSAKTEELSKVKGLNLGAADYLVKPFGVLELIARIKANLRKVEKESSSSSEYADLKIDDFKYSAYIKSNLLKLTLKEYNLLKMLVENSEKVLTRESLLLNVWGIDFFGETRTLDMHIVELRRKLALGESVAEIITIRGIGYMLRQKND